MKKKKIDGERMKILLRKMFAVENQRDGSAEALSFKINKKEISQFD